MNLIRHIAVVMAMASAGILCAAGKPSVLLIGDSISIGYTQGVTDGLKNVATVKHHAGNAEHTRTGLKKIDEWLGDTKWSVSPRDAAQGGPAHRRSD